MDRATGLIWKMLMVAEKRFSRLKAPELMVEVHQSAQYVDGVRVHTMSEEVAA